MRKTILFTLLIIFISVTLVSGALIEENGSYTNKENLERNFKPLITIVFDDGWISDMWAQEIMQFAGMRGTSFVNAEFFMQTNNLERMDTNQLKKIYDFGWEIGCHGSKHISLLNLRKDEILNIWRSNKILIQNATGGEVVSHAYPYGEYDDMIRNLVGGVYSAARSSTKGYMEYGDFDSAYYANVYFVDTMPIEDVFELIDGVLRPPGKWLILGFHKLTGKPPFAAAAPEFFKTLSEFQRIVNYINDYKIQQKLEVITFKEGVQRIRSYYPY